MLQVKCIEKIRDKNNHIIGYTIIGNDKKPIPVKSEKLKEVIGSGQIEVTNLTLTSDNRLINKRPVTSSKQINTTENLINRLKSLGYIINIFDTKCNHKCYIASSSDNARHIFIIPDDVEYIHNPYYTDLHDDKLLKYMSHIGGTLKVIGGKSLISAQSLFAGCKVQYLDLSSFDTSNVTDMSYMFYDCKTQVKINDPKLKHQLRNDRG